MRPRDLVVPALTGLVVATLAFGFVAPVPAWLPGPDVLVVVLFPAVVFLVVTAVVYRKRSTARSEDVGRSIWDAIPRWQYTGRHVESGGITRDGQEQALEEIRERAEAEEGRHR